MIDKGKYASHGAFIKRLSKSAMVHWTKPKLGKGKITQPLFIQFQHQRQDRLKLTMN
jgi:hypothetical protein